MLPPGGIEGLNWQGQANLIDHLRMVRAAKYSWVLGDAGPLQTLEDCSRDYRARRPLAMQWIARSVIV